VWKLFHFEPVDNGGNLMSLVESLALPDRERYMQGRTCKDWPIRTHGGWQVWQHFQKVRIFTSQGDSKHGS
jgi:hypothetical protein